MKSAVKTVSGMNVLRLLALTTAAMLFVPADAHAQGIGDMFGNIVNSFGTIPNILTTIAYVSGVFLAVQSMVKFKQHGDAPNQVPISEPVKRLLAGGMFLALPMSLRAAHDTIYGSGIAGTVRSGSPGWSPSGTGTLDDMVISIMMDASAPFAALLSGFCFISGIAFVLIGISRLTKTAQEGPRGPAGMGTLFCFIIGGALMNINSLMGAFTTSMFGDATTSTFASLTPDVAAALGGGAAQVETVIEAVMAFIMIVGFIAFARGLFVLKAFADGGGQNATVAQGLTFLFGGALAVNLGDLINYLQTTIGVSAFGVTFS